MLQLKEYIKVANLDEAYELNQKKKNVIIGGMHWLKMGKSAYNTAIDLSGLGLDEIVETEDSFEIGCMVSLRQLEMHAELNRYSAGAVREAVKDIVGVQFRNTATVGGSIWGRYGFSDVLTVFLAMDTTVVCHKAGEISLKEFSTKKADRDILVKLVVKKKPIKIAYFAQRHAKTDLPTLTCAVSCIGGRWSASVGARPSRATLITDDEMILSGEVTEDKAQVFGKYVAEKLAFGSNMRGSADYRRRIAQVLVRRAVMKAGKEQ